MQQRYENLNGSFKLKKFKNISKDTYIYLVDDIVSTGSTL
jgi:predicted amidophosphoribosyltransferase